MKDIMEDYFLIQEYLLNNGFIRLGHSVLEFSDRDIVSRSKNTIEIFWI